jgi:signal transduction histidine kinase
MSSDDQKSNIRRNNGSPQPAPPMPAESYEFIFRTSGDGILLTNPQGLMERINPAAAAMLGVTSEEILGKSAKQVFGQNNALTNLFIRKGEQTLDVRLPKRRLAVGVATTLGTGERLVLLQDVTEKRELESRREALINTVSHDLRNPISAMDGFAELILKFGPLNEQQTRFITRIRQTTGKLYDMIGSLVDLAWIEAGMPLEHVPLEMSVLIDRAVNNLTSLAMQKQVSIAVSVQSPMPVIMGDPERMQQVVYNLLHNAIIYSYPEQTVAIHAWADDHEAYFSVADRGLGVADDELELIFDRLYRSRDERVRELPGSGIGLTLARTIITRHGGDIWGSSNLGEGSTFTFVLPTVRLS